MLADAAPYLRCPVCHAGLELSGQALGCPAGHRFDVARQGYASLLSGDAHTGTADTAAMVAARAEFLGSGEYAPLVGAVTDAVAEAMTEAVAAAARPIAPPGCVVDAGAGTGHYLAAALERCPDRVGVACDLSRYAARRAARAHPRIGAVVADVWRGVPVRDGSAAVVLDVFAPRNAAEFHRALHPEGVLVVATPRPDHLGELVRRLGLLSVDTAKPRRLSDALGHHFSSADTVELGWTMRLSHARVGSLVAMGPSAWHTAGDVGDSAAPSGLAGLPDPVEVTGAVTLSTYRPR